MKRAASLRSVDEMTMERQLAERYIVMLWRVSVLDPVLVGR